MESLPIHPLLQDYLHPLTSDEIAGLTEKILHEGFRDPIIIWQEEGCIIDGHHRYAICQAHAIPFTTHALSFPDLDAVKLWMITQQLSRRNVTPEYASFLRGKQYEVMKQAVGRPEKEWAQSEHIFLEEEQAEDKGKGRQGKDRTAQVLGEQHHVSRETIKRDAKFAQAVDTITAAAGPDARTALLGRETRMNRQDVTKLASLASTSPQSAPRLLTAIQAAPTQKAVKQILATATKDAPVLPSLTSQSAHPRRTIETLAAPDGREMFILHDDESMPVFNKTNEMVDWASWTWNPVTGCWHGCDYCYAREIANSPRMARAYPKQFEPTFHPARLTAPANTPYPRTMTRAADKNVFTCSMADLFGKWVPDSWIFQIFTVVENHPEWNFLFLTKFPQRLQAICDALNGFPVNAWVGCTVDTQARVASAEKAFQDIRATVRWLSVEPMQERLTFTRLDMFNWVVIGGQTASYFNNTPAFQPPWEWVEHLWQQARRAGTSIYWKENLTVRPKEVPWEDDVVLKAQTAKIQLRLC